jgi:hypothetical protein
MHADGGHDGCRGSARAKTVRGMGCSAIYSLYSKKSKFMDLTSFCFQKLSQVTGLERGQVSRKITKAISFLKIPVHFKLLDKRYTVLLSSL